MRRCFLAVVMLGFSAAHGYAHPWAFTVARKESQQQNTRDHHKKIQHLKKQLLEFLKLDIQFSIESLPHSKWVGFSGDNFSESKFNQEPWLSLSFLEASQLEIVSFSSQNFASGYTYKVIKPDAVEIRSLGDQNRTAFTLLMISPTTMVVTQMSTTFAKPSSGSIFGILHRVSF